MIDRILSTLKYKDEVGRVYEDFLVIVGDAETPDEIVCLNKLPSKPIEIIQNCMAFPSHSCAFDYYRKAWVVNIEDGEWVTSPLVSVAQISLKTYAIITQFINDSRLNNIIDKYEVFLRELPGIMVDYLWDGKERVGRLWRTNSGSWWMVEDVPEKSTTPRDVISIFNMEVEGYCRLYKEEEYARKQWEWLKQKYSIPKSPSVPRRRRY